MSKLSGWTGRLGRILSGQSTVRTGQAVGPPQATANDHDQRPVDEEGRKYLRRVRDKLGKLVDDFAQGRVNRAQFEELYSHYQNERRTIEALLTASPSGGAWRDAVTEGESMSIRRRLAARVLGYAVYSNHEETPLRVYGEFTTLHERWIGPLLSRVNETTDKLFVLTSFGTEGDEMPCLCAVAGEFTTFLALFTTEPARVQVQSLEDLHAHFEQANQRVFTTSARFDKPVRPGDLVFPYAAAFE
jgi:hypothetical protein